MGNTVYVPHFNRDTIEYASREKDESKPGIKTLRPEKHYGWERCGEFSRSHSSLRCLLFASMCNFNKFIAAIRTIEGAIFSDLRRQCPASQKILYTVWRWLYIYIFISPVVHTWIYLNEKNSSVSSVWWTLLPGRGAWTKFWAFIACTLIVCCFGGRNNAPL